MLLSVWGSLVTWNLKCISVDNQTYLARMILIDLGLDYSWFMVCLENCRTSCKTLDMPSYRLYVPKKTTDVSLKVSNMMIWIKTISKTYFM